MNPHKFRLYLYALLSLALMGIIFWFSSQPATRSQVLSDGLLYNILRVLGLEDSAAMELYGKLIRKIAHFIEYAALGLSSGLFFMEYFRETVLPRNRGAFWAAGVCGLYALSDEIHQSFVPGRSMQLSDVLLDCFGAVTAIFLLFTLKNYIYSHREERKNFE